MRHGLPLLQLATFDSRADWAHEESNRAADAASGVCGSSFPRSNSWLRKLNLAITAFVLFSLAFGGSFYADSQAVFRAFGQ